MFGSLRKMVGNIHVSTKGNQVVVDGMPRDVYMNDIYKLWKTSKVEDYMFTRTSSASVSFHQFFLPDVYYTIEEVLKNPTRGSAFNYRALRKALEEIKTNTWMCRALSPQPDILDFSQINQMNVSPLPHQSDFFRVYNDVVPRYGLRGLMLGAVPGSGKTIAGLMLSCMVKADVTVIIAPKNSINSVWEDTIATRFKNPVDYWISSSKEEPTPGKRFYVFHYEQLGRAVEFFTKHKPLNPMVILDESHNMNEIESLRTQLFVELCRDVLKSKHVIWASGTPIKAIGTEAIPLLRTIDPLFDDAAEQRFKKIFGKSMSRAVDILRNRIGFLTFKVEKAVVIKNEVENFTRNVQIPNGKIYTLDVIKEEMRVFVTERMKYYKDNFAKYEAQYKKGLDLHEALIARDKNKLKAYDMYKGYIRTIRKGFDPGTMKELAMYCNRYELKEIIPFLPPGTKDDFKNARSVIKYYDLKVRGEALGRILGKKRAQCHVDMVPFCDLETEIDSARKKTVIFTSYVEVVDAIYEMLLEKGYKPLRVYGNTNKDLPRIVEQFGSDEDANPLIATFQSLSTAVPLVMASTAIMMNSPFRIHELEQATARVDRIGQDGPVTIVSIFLKTGEEGNISTRSGDILEWSRDAVNAIMGIKTDVGEIAIESFDEVMVEVENAEDEFSVEAEIMQNPDVISADKPVYMNW